MKLRQIQKFISIIHTHYFRFCKYYIDSLIQISLDMKIWNQLLDEVVHSFLWVV